MPGDHFRARCHLAPRCNGGRSGPVAGVPKLSPAGDVVQLIMLHEARGARKIAAPTVGWLPGDPPTTREDLRTRAGASAVVHGGQDATVDSA